ncbi:MAG: hypothetical protein RMI90_01400 [Thermoguttaceae bacterium]|nr:hypothetical protein [Thermoguttaceae bacterium]
MVIQTSITGVSLSCHSRESGNPENLPLPSGHWYLHIFSEPEYVGVNWSARPQHFVGESHYVDTNAPAVGEADQPTGWPGEGDLVSCWGRNDALTTLPVPDG